MGGLGTLRKVPEMFITVGEPTYSFTKLAGSMGELGQLIKKTNETVAMHSVIDASVDFLKRHGQDKCAAMLEKLKDKVETDVNAKTVAFAYCDLTRQYMELESIWKKHEKAFKVAYTKADGSEKKYLIAEYQKWLQAYNSYAGAFIRYFHDPFGKESEKKLSEATVACNTTSASFVRTSSAVEVAAKYRTELNASRKNAEEYLQRVNELIKITDQYVDSKEKKEKMQFLYAEKMKAEQIIKDIDAVHSTIGADKMYVLGSDGEYHANVLFGTPLDNPKIPYAYKTAEEKKLVKFQKENPDSFIPGLDRLASAFKYKSDSQKQGVYDYLDVMCWKELLRAATDKKDKVLHERAYEAAKTAMAPYTEWSTLDSALENFRFSEKDNEARKITAKEFMMSSRYDTEKEAVKVRHIAAWNALIDYNEGTAWSMKKADAVIELYNEAQAELSGAINTAYKKEVLGQGFFKRNAEVLVDVGVGAVGAVGTVLTFTPASPVGLGAVALSSAYFAGKGASGFVIAAKQGDAAGMAFSGIMTVTAGLGTFGTGLKLISPALGLGRTLTYTMAGGGILLTGDMIYEGGKTIVEGQQFGWTEVRSMELASNGAFLLFGASSSLVAKKLGAEPQKCKEIARDLGEMHEVAPGIWDVSPEARAALGWTGKTTAAKPVAKTAKPAESQRTAARSSEEIEVSHPVQIFEVPPEVRAQWAKVQKEAKAAESNAVPKSAQAEGSALHPPAQGVEQVNARIRRGAENATEQRAESKAKPAEAEGSALHPPARFTRPYNPRAAAKSEPKPVEKPTEAEGSVLYPRVKGVEEVNARMRKAEPAKKPRGLDETARTAEVVELSDFRKDAKPKKVADASKPVEILRPEIAKSEPVTPESYGEQVAKLSEQNREYVSDHFEGKLPDQATLDNALILFGDRGNEHRVRANDHIALEEVNLVYNTEMSQKTGHAIESANGYYDPATGRIVTFGSPNDVPAVIRSKYKSFTLVLDKNEGRIMGVTGENVPASLTNLKGMKHGTGIDEVNAAIAARPGGKWAMPAEVPKPEAKARPVEAKEPVKTKAPVQSEPITPEALAVRINQLSERAKARYVETMGERAFESVRNAKGNKEVPYAVEEKMFEVAAEHGYEAHGVEGKGMFGGLVDLTSIAVSRKILGGKGGAAPYSGLMGVDQSHLGSGAHGPFFVLLKPYLGVGGEYAREGGRLYIPGEQHLAYLVPNKIAKTALLSALDAAYKDGKMSRVDYLDAKGKVITYEEFVKSPPELNGAKKQSEPKTGPSIAEQRFEPVDKAPARMPKVQPEPDVYAFGPRSVPIDRYGRTPAMLEEINRNPKLYSNVKGRVKQFWESKGDLRIIRKLLESLGYEYDKSVGSHEHWKKSGSRSITVGTPKHIAPPTIAGSVVDGLLSGGMSLEQIAAAFSAVGIK